MSARKSRFAGGGWAALMLLGLGCAESSGSSAAGDGSPGPGPTPSPEVYDCVTGPTVTAAELEAALPEPSCGVLEVGKFSAAPRADAGFVVADATRVDATVALADALASELPRATVVSWKDRLDALVDDRDAMLGLLDGASSDDEVQSRVEELNRTLAKRRLLVSGLVTELGGRFQVYVALIDVFEARVLQRAQATVDAEAEVQGAAAGLAGTLAAAAAQLGLCVRLTPRVAAIDFEDPADRARTFSVEVVDLRGEAPATPVEVLLSVGYPEDGAVSPASVTVAAPGQAVFTMTRRRPNTLTASVLTALGEERTARADLLPLCAKVLEVRGTVSWDGRRLQSERDPSPDVYSTTLGESEVYGFAGLARDDAAGILAGDGSFVETIVGARTATGHGWIGSPENVCAAEYRIAGVGGGPLSVVAPIVASGPTTFLGAGFGYGEDVSPISDTCESDQGGMPSLDTALMSVREFEFEAELPYEHGAVTRARADNGKYLTDLEVTVRRLAR